MDFILHTLGLCSDHHSHLNVFDLVVWLQERDLFRVPPKWYIQEFFRKIL